MLKAMVLVTFGLASMCPLTAQDSQQPGAGVEFDQLVSAFRSTPWATGEARFPFLPRFLAAAKKYAGQDGAIPFLVWTVRMGWGPRAEGEEALGVLLADHIQSETIASIIASVPYYAEPTETLTRIYEENPHDPVRAQALFVRGTGGLRGENTDANREAAIADFREVIVLSSDETLRAQTERAIFEAENLAIGMVAPEIEGSDLDGAALSLSDYRGKVVLLDFWGDW